MPGMRSTEIVAIALVAACTASCKATAGSSAPIPPDTASVTTPDVRPATAIAFSEAAVLSTSEPESTTLVDIDGDGALDLVTAANRDVLVHLATENGYVPGPSFALAPEQGVKGWGLGDVDDDGDLDLLPATRAGGTEPVAYLGGDGTLTPAPLGVIPGTVARTVLLTDFDGDSIEDLLVSGSSFRTTHGPPELHRGLDGGGFDPENILPTVAPAPYWQQVVSAPGTPCDGETWAAAWFKGVVVRDFDLDGRPDIVMNAFGDAGFPDGRCPEFHQRFATLDSYRGMFFLHNRSTPGTLSFTDAPSVFDGGAYGNTLDDDQFYTSVPADLDDDGDLDLVSGGVVFGDERRQRDTAAVRVWRNDSTPGAPSFADVTASSGELGALNLLPPAEKAKRRLSDGVALDLENDGDVDLAFTNRDDSGTDDGAPGVVVFRNDSDMSFTELSATATGLDQYSNAINAADLDGDGLVDIVIDDKFFTAQTYVFPNATSGTGAWLGVDVRTPDGAWAVGARVTVTDANGTVLASDEVRTDYSYRGKREPRVHVGLGDVTTVDIRVDMPFGGATTWLRDVPADQIVTVEVDR
jgi:hypothetical protein